MSDDYTMVLHGLLRKRGELSRDLAALRDQENECLTALDAIDTAIRVFHPDIGDDLLPERPAPPPSAAFRGEVQRFLLHTLRTAEQPQSTTQLAHAVMQSRGLNTGDRVLGVLVRKRTGHSLGRLRKAGFVDSRRFGGGGELEWWVAVRE